MSSTNIQIAVKVRPLIERELKEKVEPLWLIKDNSIVHIDGAQNFIGEPYSFDHIFDQRRTNKEVYDAVVKPLVMSCLEGINSTIFAYGQTSSGKTHTMLGDKDVPGIIMYTVEDIFKHIGETATKNFLLRCSYLEIYNEKINDLLDTQAKDLKIREDYDQMVHVHAKEEVIRESNELLVLMKKGMKTRKIGCTDMNERSSRSHTIFKLVIQSQNKDSEGSYTESSLSLVDLAGSERVGQMNMKGERQAEGVSINKSLTTLGLVIRKLSENEQFINYRDSKLTRLLQHSLGGNSRTLIICTVTVAAAEETKSTLEFAQRAKYVKNRPIINEKVTDKDQLKQYAHLCQDYKGQIEKLRFEKLEREKTINALEDKISNIRLFTSGNFEKTVKVSKIPQRRHTLGYYKPFMTKHLVPILDSEGSDESTDEDDLDKEKSSVLFTITDEDDKENVNIDTDTIAGTPSNILGVPKTPKAPKTPSPVSKMETGLLEESYDSLKTFTNYEKQLMGQYDEIKELIELTDKLRNENMQLKQQNIKENQQYFNVVETNKEIFDQLILLRSILERRPVEETRRHSLHTITEEDFEIVGDQVDPLFDVGFLDQLTLEIKKNEEANRKCVMLSEENQLLKQQLEDKKHLSSLNVPCADEIDEKEAKCVALATENEQLRNQLETKNFKIDQLETSIGQHKDIKEAELEILTKKIKQLNDYKEEMHEQLSELQQSKLSKDVNVQKESYKHECDELTIKIGELEEENRRLKTEFPKQADLDTRIKDLSEKNKSLREAENEITDLKRTVTDLESQLNVLKSNYHRVQEFNLQFETEKELASKENYELKEIIILRENRIAELEKCQENSTAKFDENMKEKFNAREQERADMEKEIERLTQVELEYTTIINNIRDVLGEEFDIDNVNTLRALKNDNQNFRRKLESEEQLVTELNNQIDNLKKELAENNDLKNWIDNNSSIFTAVEKENVTLRDLNKEYLLKIQDLHNQNVDLTEKLIEQIVETKALQSLLDQVTSIRQTVCQYKQTIEHLSATSVDLHNQLREKLLELDIQRKQNDVLNEKLKKFNEQMNRCTLFETDNNRLKSELEDVVFQLSGEQKEVENMSQQLDEKSLVIAGLEKNILNLKGQINVFKLETEKLQEVSNINVTLREALSKKEEEIKILKDNCRLLDQTYTETKNKLQQDILQLTEKNEEYNKLITYDILKPIAESQNLKLKTTQIESASQSYRCFDDRQQKLEQEMDNLVKENTESKEKFQNNINPEHLISADDEFKIVHDKSSQEHLLEEINRDRFLEEENYRLKSDLEHIISELGEEQKELKKLREQLNQKCLETAGLEKEILHLEELIQLSELKMEKSQELSHINTTLREDLRKKEEEIKILKDKFRILNQEYSETKNQLQQNVLLLNEKNDAFNNAVASNNVNTLELESLISRNSELRAEIEMLSQDYRCSNAHQQELEEKVAILVQDNAGLKEKLQKNADLEQNLAKDVTSLKDKCSTQELQLQDYNERLNCMLEELDSKIESYNKLNAKCTTQELELENYKEQLNNKSVELDEKSQLYNNILTNYAAKNVKIEYLETEIEDLKNKLYQLYQKEEETNKVQQLLAQRYNDINKLEKENLKLKTHLDSSGCLQTKLDRYALDITILKDRHDSLHIEFNHLKSQLNTITVEVEEKIIENKCLIEENEMLKNQLNNLSQKQLAHDIIQQEKIKEHKDEKSYLKQQVDQLINSNMEINLQLSRLTTDLNSKQQEIEYLKKSSEQKSFEIKIFEKDKAKQTEKLELALKDLLDMKRFLDKRSEELSHFKGKYNALEVQFHDFKDSLTAKTREELLLRNEELESKLESVTLTLNQVQNENKLKAVPLKSASEEIQASKQNVLDVATLQVELEQYKLKLSRSEEKMTMLKQMHNTEAQRSESQLKQRLNLCKEHSKVLEFQLEEEKAKVESLTQKLQLSVSEIDSLQVKVNDLILYRKRIQEKIVDGTLKEIPLPRLSDEGRPLSPNELRKIKRQSIHDQRRGLALEPSDPSEISDIDCTVCKELRMKLAKTEEQNKKLRTDIENLKKENVFLDSENEDMLKIIKDMEQSENDLHNQLQSCRNSAGSGDDEIRLLQIKYNEVLTMKTELENELLLNKKLITKYRNRIADMENNYLETEQEHENVKKDLRKNLDDCHSIIRRTLPSVKDKETQATCDLHEKYKIVKKLAQIRRQEGNYLRAKLNLPPDCAVLPEDIQRQPTNL